VLIVERLNHAHDRMLNTGFGLRTFGADIACAE